MWLLVAIVAGTAWAQAPPPDGARLYGSFCAHCHGANAEGARGPALARERLDRATDDAAFVRIVQEGIPNTEMPPSRLEAGEIRQIQSYLRTLVARRPAAGPTGAAERGESLFRGKGGCLRCHMVDGEGGRMGPELSAIRLSRSASRLRTAIVDPGAEVADNFAQYRLVIPMPDNFVLLRVRTRDGREVRGIRLNEDPFSVQIRGLDDQLHSFLKSELAELTADPAKSPMPSYRDTLTAPEVDDLVAYLLSLRRSQ